MPSSLPVPSKGALRTLRNLALGTSCTVAFSAGLLTEDRRRRISSVREVHNNAKKLKSSKNYHSAASLAIADVFEKERCEEGEQVVGGQEEGESLRRETVPLKRCIPLGEQPVGREEEEASLRKETVPLKRYKPLIERKNAQRPREANIRYQKSYLPVIAPPKVTLQPLDPEKTKVRFSNRSARIAADVMNLLEGPQDSETVNAATARFLEAVDDGLDLSHGIGKPLLTAACRLSAACWARSSFDACERILRVITCNPPVDEAAFNLLHPFEIIEDLLQGPLDESNSTIIETAKLKKASSIFLTKFKEKPGILSDYGMEVGKRLCAATCRAGLSETTIKVYWRLAKSSSGNGHWSVVQYLLTAHHQQGDHKEVVDIFSRFFTRTSPDQKELYSIGNLAMDSALTLKNLDKAEKIMVSALEMAEIGGHAASTTWILKLLGHTWRSKRDMTGIRALFSQYEPLIRLTSHPRAPYSAMVQFCVEAGDEAAAKTYQSRYEELYEDKRPDLRTCGHFALAKAMREDWNGVKEDFRKMADLVTEDDNQVYTAVFVPVLMLFIKSHQIDEVEQFLRLYLGEFKVPLNIFISNAMVEVYAHNREMDSLIRWLQYAASLVPSINSVTLNAIISNCHKSWGFSFDQCYALYKRIRDLENGKGRVLIDQTTMSILHDIALKEVNSPSHKDWKLELGSNGSTASYPTDSYGVQRNMILALTKNDPQKALRVYREAVQNHVPLDSRVLVTATEASLKLHGENLRPTAELLKEAQENRGEIAPALATVLVHQTIQRVENRSLDKMDVMQVLNNMAATLKNSNVVVPKAATHGAHILVTRGLYREAIDLWTTVSRRQGLSPNSINLPTFTVLIMAYIGLRDTVGVRWVSRTMSSNGLKPDKMFVERLKYARAQARKRIQESRRTMYLDSIAMKELINFHDAIVNALDTAIAERKEWRRERKQVQYKTIRLMKDALEALGAPETEAEILSTKADETRAANGNITAFPAFELTQSPVGSEKECLYEPTAEWLV